MRLCSVLLCLAAACFGSQSSLSQSCEPTASARAVLEQLQVPDIAHLPAAQRRELKLQLLRKALAAAPSDIALHEAYQNARLGGMEINRPDSIAEYEQLLAKHANDSVFLYLAAEAQMGRKTKAAIANLQRAIERSPGFGLPHLLLAQIYFSRAYENTAEVNRQLGRFAELCPASVRAVGTVKWSKDKELIAREAARLRHNLEVRTDSEAVAAYPTLWSFEGALERSDQQSENLARRPNYGKRYRAGQRISTGFVESAVNEIVAKRMVKKQQMRWNRHTVRSFLDVRIHVLNGTLENAFR